MTETPNDAESKDWKQTIYRWIAEEGMFRREVDDPKASFHFGVNYPVGSPYHIEVVKPRDMKDGVLVIAMLRVAPAHRTALTKLAPEKRQPLLFHLRMRLLEGRPGFSVKEQDGVWDAVQFQVRVLYDVLTKTALIEAIDDVLRSMLMVIWTFGHRFGVPTGEQPQPGFYT